MKTSSRLARPALPDTLDSPVSVLLGRFAGLMLFLAVPPLSVACRSLHHARSPRA